MKAFHYTYDYNTNPVFTLIIKIKIKKIALLNILFKLSSEKKPGVGKEATILDQNSPLDFHL